MDNWKQWLTDEALAELNLNGYYIEKFATNEKVYEKVNVLAVNTMPAYANNLYLIGERQDPGNQLKWLEEKLTELEQKGEIAILIAH